MDKKGEQVFGNNADEILAEKIVRRARQNTHVDDTAAKAARTATRTGRVDQDARKPLVLFAGLLGVILLLSAAIAARLLRPAARTRQAVPQRKRQKK